MPLQMACQFVPNGALGEWHPTGRRNAGKPLKTSQTKPASCWCGAAHWSSLELGPAGIDQFLMRPRVLSHPLTPHISSRCVMQASLAFGSIESHGTITVCGPPLAEARASESDADAIQCGVRVDANGADNNHTGRPQPGVVLET